MTPEEIKADREYMNAIIDHHICEKDLFEIKARWSAALDYIEELQGELKAVNEHLSETHNKTWL